MSENPTVCCVLLTRDRPAMAARAVESFRRQTYEQKRLLVFDTSPCASGWHQYMLALRLCGDEMLHAVTHPAGSIGGLRNQANRVLLPTEADIIAHWDDDDWSHPNRLSEQVALLQSSGADAVAYNQMLFWDSRKYAARRERHAEVQYVGGQRGCMVEGYINEAWLYSGIHDQILGTSLCYWRKTWQQKPFPETGPQSDRGEDMAFVAGLKVKAVSSLQNGEPRMIAGVHGSNHSTVINNSREWSRVPDWDNWCREVMQL